MQLHWDTLTPTRRVLADVDVSASDLQVLDLKAAGALSSFAVTCATFLTSATTMAAHSIMVCALSQRRLLASAQTCSPDLSSS